MLTALVVAGALATTPRPHGMPPPKGDDRTFCGVDLEHFETTREACDDYLAAFRRRVETPCADPANQEHGAGTGECVLKLQAAVRRASDRYCAGRSSIDCSAYYNGLMRRAPYCQVAANLSLEAFNMRQAHAPREIAIENLLDAGGPIMAQLSAADIESLVDGVYAAPAGISSSRYAGNLYRTCMKRLGADVALKPSPPPRQKR